MKTLSFGALVALSFVCAPASAQTLHFATDVPDVAHWNNESSTTGMPGGGNCDMTGGAYADNPSGDTRLVAQDFEAFTLPAGHRVTWVEVGVMARFDMGAPAIIDVRAQWLRDGATQMTTVNRDFPLSNPPGNGNCSWNDFDITGADPWWSQEEVNRLVVGVRRASAFPGNELRVKGFRVRVATEPCSGALMVLCGGQPNVTGHRAQLTANGPLSLSSDISLNVTGGPPLSIGFTYVGRSTGVWLPSGNGILCLGTILRHYPPVQLSHSGAASVIIQPSHPAFMGNVSLGDQTVLQFVYRDPINAGFNLSDALYGYPCP